ncbi:hypothetical protein FJV83_19420 [Mesorhizobium sp. WSM4307]|nr:hypothetical protein FJV81_25890 [Mesorhizobium sp. WSM4315]TRC83607.1 hypothetical protein FJV83_19420 [Mesorhizobium sp. WSM4307]
MMCMGRAEAQWRHLPDEYGGWDGVFRGNCDARNFSRIRRTRPKRRHDRQHRCAWIRVAHDKASYPAKTAVFSRPRVHSPSGRAGAFIR